MKIPIISRWLACRERDRERERVGQEFGKAIAAAIGSGDGTGPWMMRCPGYYSCKQTWIATSKPSPTPWHGWYGNTCGGVGLPGTMVVDMSPTRFVKIT